MGKSTLALKFATGQAAAGVQAIGVEGRRVPLGPRSAFVANASLSRTLSTGLRENRKYHGTMRDMITASSYILSLISTGDTQ